MIDSRWFERAADGMCIVDARGSVKAANAAFRALGGSEGQPWYAVLHAEQAEPARLLLEATLAGEEPRPVTLTAGSTKRPRHLNISLSVEGREALVVVRDVTAIVEAEDKAQALLRASPAILWSMDMDGRILFSDGGGLVKLGMAPGATVGMSVFEMYEHMPALLDNVRRSLAGETVQTRESLGPVVLDTWYAPLVDEEGQRTGVMGMSLDATEQVTAEQELRERLVVIEKQAEAIRTLSVLVLEVWDSVLAAPVVGQLDAARAELLMERVLEAVRSRRARYAILDLTGVDAIDTSTADHVLKLCKAVGLLGTKALLSGIQPPVAQTLVALGVDMGEVKVVANLQAALRVAMGRAGGEARSPRPTW